MARRSTNSLRAWWRPARLRSGLDAPPPPPPTPILLDVPTAPLPAPRLLDPAPIPSAPSSRRQCSSSKCGKNEWAWSSLCMASAAFGVDEASLC